ncbi:hypothetical protein CLV49_2739 [Labedella gwakjiensis]|uniref:Uncharacterized protein n=1 Tax=Labedella gwakjiensis TaxID=390269 RepID=A0A2P8GYS8_9MICO|nr:hypothetical protein CLV49_2739 [Labedella gwakjiensis]
MEWLATLGAAAIPGLIALAGAALQQAVPEN